MTFWCPFSKSACSPIARVVFVIFECWPYPDFALLRLRFVTFCELFVVDGSDERLHPEPFYRTENKLPEEPLKLPRSDQR